MSFIGWFMIMGLCGFIFMRKPLGRRMQGLGEEQVRNQLASSILCAVICGIIGLLEYVTREDEAPGWLWLVNLPGAIASWYAILAVVELGKRAGATFSSQMQANQSTSRQSPPGRPTTSTPEEIKLRVVQRTQSEIPVHGVTARDAQSGQQASSPSGTAPAASSWEEILRRVHEAAASAKQPGTAAPVAPGTPAPAAPQPGAQSAETYPAPAFSFWHPEAEPAPTADPAAQTAAAAVAAGATAAHPTLHPEQRQPERRRGVHDVADTVHHEGMKVELGVTRKIGEGASTSAAQAHQQHVVATAGKSALPVRPPGPVRIGGSSLARPGGPVSLGGGSMARKPGPLSLGGGAMARPAGPLSLSAGQVHLAGPLSGTGRTGVVSRIGVSAALHTPRTGTDVLRQESATQESATGEQPDSTAVPTASVNNEAKH